jgi:hypothetical protein
MLVPLLAQPTIKAILKLVCKNLPSRNFIKCAKGFIELI